MLLILVVLTTATATPKTCIFYGYNIYCYDFLLLLKKIKSVVIIFCDFERRVKDFKSSNLSLLRIHLVYSNTYVRKYKVNSTDNIQK